MAAPAKATTAAPPATALTNLQKAAVLLLCMDEETSGQVMHGLGDDEIRKVGSALLSLKEIPAATIQDVVNDFGKTVRASRHIPPAPPSALMIDGAKVAEKFLSKTVPDGRGELVFQSLFVPVADTSEEQFDLRAQVAKLSENALAKLLTPEHPQVVALVLTQAKRGTAKAIINKYPEEARGDLFMRMAELDKVSDTITRDIAQYFSQKVAEQAAAQSAAKAPGVAGAPAAAVEEEEEETPGMHDVEVGGLMQTVKLLKSLPPEQAQKIIEGFAATNPELAERIKKQMFVVEDLERSEDAGIRELLRNVTNDDLKAVLKNAGDGLKQKIFKNMSERASLILREDMEVLAPLKVEEIEAAQERILDAAKKLMQEEKMKLAPIPDEDA